MNSTHLKKRFRDSLIVAVVFCLFVLYDLFISKSPDTFFSIVILIAMPTRALIDYYAYKVGTTDTKVYKYGSWLIYVMIALLIISFIMSFF